MPASLRHARSNGPLRPCAKRAGGTGPAPASAFQPAMTAAIALAVRSTLPLFKPATQMRPERTR